MATVPPDCLASMIDAVSVAVALSAYATLDNSAAGTVYVASDHPGWWSNGHFLVRGDPPTQASLLDSTKSAAFGQHIQTIDSGQRISVSLSGVYRFKGDGPPFDARLYKSDHDDNAVLIRDKYAALLDGYALFSLPGVTLKNAPAATYHSVLGVDGANQAMVLIAPLLASAYDLKRYYTKLRTSV